MPTDYKPYGPEWEAELMKWHKRDIIRLLKEAIHHIYRTAPPELLVSTRNAIEAILEERSQETMKQQEKKNEKKIRC